MSGNQKLRGGWAQPADLGWKPGHTQASSIGTNNSSSRNQNEEIKPDREYQLRVSWHWKVNLGNRSTREPTARFVSRAGTRTWHGSSCSQVATKTSRKNKSEQVLTNEHESTENRRLACCRNRDRHALRAKIHNRITPEPREN
jgi:hypothetical protein